MDRGHSHRAVDLTAPRRRGWGRALRAVLPFVGLVVAVAILLLLVDVREVGAALLSANPWWVLAGLGLALNATGIVALKLWAVVRIVDMPRTVRQTWSAVMSGLTLNAVLPARGGDLVRAVFLAREPGSLTVLLGAVFVERLIDVSAIGTLVLLTGVGLDWITGLAVAVIGAAVVGTVALAWLGPRSPIRPDLGERLARTAGMAVRRPGWAATAFVLSLAAWTNNAFMLLFAMWSVGVQVPVALGLRAGTVAILAGIVPVTISGIGTRDATLVMLLDSLGQPDAVAAGALLFTVMGYWFLALLGAVALGPETLRTVRARMEQSRGSTDDIDVPNPPLTEP